MEQMREFAAAGRPEVRARTPRPKDARNTGAYSVEQGFYSPHDYEALLMTPATMGLRLGEFLGLRRCDYRDGKFVVEHSAHEGSLVRSSRQKNHDRNVPVPPSLAAKLDLLLEVDGDELDPIFRTPTGRMWSERKLLPRRLDRGEGRDRHGSDSA